jgi:hypothetical protein
LQSGVGAVSRPGTGAAIGAVSGLVCAGLLIVLPVASSDDTDARNVEWLANFLFVGLPLVLLGTFAGSLIAGRAHPPSPEQSHRRRATVVAVGVVAIALFVLAGTTNLLS